MEASFCILLSCPLVAEGCPRGGLCKGLSSAPLLPPVCLPCLSLLAGRDCPSCWLRSALLIVSLILPTAWAAWVEGGQRRGVPRKSECSVACKCRDPWPAAACLLAARPVPLLKGGAQELRDCAGSLGGQEVGDLAGPLASEDAQDTVVGGGNPMSDLEPLGIPHGKRQQELVSRALSGPWWTLKPRTQ